MSPPQSKHAPAGGSRTSRLVAGPSNDPSAGGSRASRPVAGPSNDPSAGVSRASRPVAGPSNDPSPGPSWKASSSSFSSGEESETGAEDVLHCSSALLASRLRKVAPSIQFDNRRSSIEFPTKKIIQRMGGSNIKCKDRQRSCLKPTEVQQNIGFAKKDDSKSAKLYEHSNQVHNEESYDVEDEELKLFPVSVREKRRRKSCSLNFIPKVSWNRKISQKLHSILQIIKKIFQYNPWNEHLKVIESRRGANIVSYFLFVRWLLLMNILILLLNLIFLVLPHVTSQALKSETNEDAHMHIIVGKEFGNNADYNLIVDVADQTSADQSLNKMNMSKLDIIKYCSVKYDKSLIANHTKVSDFVQQFLQGTGVLESSLLFLGYYPRASVAFFGFIINVPLAFVMLFIVFMVICLIMMIQYSSHGIKEAFLTKKNFLNFTNDVFCAWDYCIQDLKAAKLQRQWFYMQIRSNLFEVRQKREIRSRSKRTRIKLYIIRLSINVLIIAWIACCYFLIIQTILFQMQEQKNLHTSGIYTMAIQYIPSFIIIIIRVPSMLLFSSLVSYEKYTSQVKVNISIYRNAFLNLSSIVVLIITLKKHLSCEPKDICGAGAGKGCKAPMCWETYVGQQLYKLALSQIVFEIPMALFYSIPRDVIVRKYDNKFTRLWGRPMFLLHFEVLWPIHAQTILWLGVFHSPLLPCVTISYLFLILYIKKAIVLDFSNLPSLTFKASRFNSTFMNILMISFLIVIISDVYTLISMVPSPGCGPFRIYESMIGALIQSLLSLPNFIILFWNFIFSGWFIIPAIILECAILYYYWKYIGFLKQYERNLKAELFIITQDNQFLLSKVNLAKSLK